MIIHAPPGQISLVCMFNANKHWHKCPFQTNNPDCNCVNGNMAMYLVWGRDKHWQSRLARELQAVPLGATICKYFLSSGKCGARGGSSPPSLWECSCYTLRCVQRLEYTGTGCFLFIFCLRKCIMFMRQLTPIKLVKHESLFFQWYLRCLKFFPRYTLHNFHSWQFAFIPGWQTGHRISALCTPRWYMI